MEEKLIHILFILSKQARPSGEIMSTLMHIAGNNDIGTAAQMCYALGVMCGKRSVRQGAEN